jgi:beta-phosphoglucomutase-like phosphatase (HAD superfamily)
MDPVAALSLKALIFDVDGTLADTEEAHRCAFNEAFEHHATGWHWSKAKYSELLRTTGGKERLGAYVESLALPPDEQRALREQIAAIHSTKTDAYTRMVRSGGVPLRQGIKPLIDEARGAGVVLAIATTTTLANIEALLNTNLGPGALALFSVIGAGDQVSRKKPAPDIYEWVLRQLALPASHCVAIEDSVNGLTAAKGAGLFTVVTPSYWTQCEDFTAADWVVPPAAARAGTELLNVAEIERRLISFTVTG